jgi:(E)-4-hydroxy-3-methylbut-2-enyl-diphosphate synthase
MQIADRGADIVRITVQGKREADACFEIKNTLVQKKYVYISTVRSLLISC